MRRRWTDMAAFGVLTACMLVMAVGFLHAQVSNLPTTPFEAAMGEQLRGLGTRVDKLETMWNYAMIGIFGNLVSHVLTLSRDRGRRRE